MKSITPATIHNSKVVVKSLPLPPHVLAALQAKYHRPAAVQSLGQLREDVVHTLEQAQQQLGWPSPLSLAHKYYPLYPRHRAWTLALQKCRHVRLRTATLNIKYLLKVVATMFDYLRHAAYSGKQSLNRLVHSTNNSTIKNTNRLTQGVWGKTDNSPVNDPDKYIKGRYGHMVHR